MNRRAFLLSTAAVALAGPALAATPPPATPVKTLRYAMRIAETGLDPVSLNDTYSRSLTAHIFEALYTFDPLARPVKVVPLIAASDPAVSVSAPT